MHSDILCLLSGADRKVLFDFRAADDVEGVAMLTPTGVADEHMLGDRNGTPSVRVNDEPESLLLLESQRNALKNQNILGRMHSEPERPLTDFRSLEPPPTANYRSCPEIGPGQRSEDGRCKQKGHSSWGIRKHFRGCPVPAATTVVARPVQAHLWPSSRTGMSLSVVVFTLSSCMS